MGKQKWHIYYLLSKKGTQLFLWWPYLTSLELGITFTLTHMLPNEPSAPGFPGWQDVCRSSGFINQFSKNMKGQRSFLSGMCGAELFPAGQGGAGRRWKSAGRSGAGRGKKARKSTDPKLRQKFVNCYWGICITVWCFDQGKHYILWL